MMAGCSTLRRWVQKVKKIWLLRWHAPVYLDRTMTLDACLHIVLLPKAAHRKPSAKAVLELAARMTEKIPEEA